MEYEAAAKALLYSIEKQLVSRKLSVREILFNNVKFVETAVAQLDAFMMYLKEKSFTREDRDMLNGDLRKSRNDCQYLLLAKKEEFLKFLTKAHVPSPTKGEVYIFGQFLPASDDRPALEVQFDCFQDLNFAYEARSAVQPSSSTSSEGDLGESVSSPRRFREHDDSDTDLEEDIQEMLPVLIRRTSDRDKRKGLRKQYRVFKDWNGRKQQKLAQGEAGRCLPLGGGSAVSRRTVAQRLDFPTHGLAEGWFPPNRLIPEGQNDNFPETVVRVVNFEPAEQSRPRHYFPSFAPQQVAGINALTFNEQQALDTIDFRRVTHLPVLMQEKSTYQQREREREREPFWSPVGLQNLLLHEDGISPEEISPARMDSQQIEPSVETEEDLPDIDWDDWTTFG